MANLNIEQAEAVMHKDGPCLVLAGPGSGKTFTLVERIRHLIEQENVNPRSILVITFSKKAADEMQRRFIKLTPDKNYPVYFGTFHAVFFSIIREYDGINTGSVLTETDKRIITDRILLKGAFGDMDEDFKISLSANISAYKTALWKNGKDDASDLYHDEKERSIFLKIYKQYVVIVRRNNKIDFEDMLYRCRNILINEPGILKKYRDLYRYFLVDEFQDINDVQYEILMMLAGDNANVFAVGDDDQSIYGFRGSDPAFMQKFISDLRGRDKECRVIDMHRNYRCAECVIDAAHSLIVHNEIRISKKQTAGKADKDDGSVTVVRCKNAKEEAEYVSGKITDYTDQKLSMAVIYRTSKCADILEELLVRRGIKCIRGYDKNRYYEKEWIKDIFAYLRTAANNVPAHDTAQGYAAGAEITPGYAYYADTGIYRIINRPDRGILRDDTDGIQRLYEKIIPMSKMSAYAALIYVLKVLGYEKYYMSLQLRKGVDEITARDELNELIDISKHYKSIKDWLEVIESVSNCEEGKHIEFGNAYNTSNIKNEADNTKNNFKDISVNMLTAHASKGLEYDVVFIIGLQEGIFPHRRAMLPSQIEEERRLLYVAMTRASKHLYIIGRGEEMHGKRISSFISEINLPLN